MPPPPNRVFVIGLLLLLGLASVLILLPFASFVLTGLLAVYFLTPLYNRVIAKWGWPRLTAAVFLVLLFVFIIAPFVYVGWVLVREATQLVAETSPQQIQDGIQSLADRISLSFGVTVPESVRTFDAGSIVGPIQRWVATHVTNVLVFAARVFIGIIVMAFVVYYGLLEGPKLVAYVRSVMPLTEAHVSHLLAEIRKVVEAVFLGQIVAALSQAALALVGFLIFGLPHPFFWAFVLAVFAVVPFLGSAVVWGPAVAYLLLAAPAWKGVGLLLWSIVLVVNVDNVVKPYVIGSRTALHPVFVLVGILGGLLFFGPVGFVVGPLVLAMFFAVLNFWRDDYLPHYRVS
ncbi:MAG TPA: AI-2E family transporter [Candidatus Thermoplasmatota archaeon]|nr:AI-2E family transporter [Candidatus Thermoplasmatota archaeon]